MKRTTRQAWGLALWSALAGVALTGCGTAADESALSNELIQANDDAFTTSRNQAGTSPYVLANDTTSQRSAVGLRITSFSQGARGSVNYNHDGTFTYTADQNKDAGQDSFTYTATDERGVSKSATVRVTTTAAWDAAGYRLPGANAFSPFAASNVQTFTFANGGALLLWSQSAIAPAVGTLQTVWMREYRPDTGWSNNKPIISGILNWKAHHSSAANSLFLVAMQPKPGIADPSKITGALYAYRYDALQGWVKASNNANAEIASTLISGTDGNAPIALPLETNYVVNARASVNADSNGNSSEDGSAVVVWQQGSPTSTLRSNSYKNLSTGSNAPGWDASPYRIDTYPNATTPRTVNDLQLIADNRGRIIALWRATDPTAPNSEQLWVNARAADGNWGANPALLEPSTTFALLTAVKPILNPTGNLTLVWARTDALTPNVFANRIEWTATAWAVGNPATITLPANSSAPVINADASGSVVVAWTAPSATTTTPLNVYASRLIPGTNSSSAKQWEPAVLLDVPSNPTTTVDGDSKIRDIYPTNDGLVLLWNKFYAAPTGGNVTPPNKLWARRFASAGTASTSVSIYESIPDLADTITVNVNRNGDIHLFMLKKSASNVFSNDLHNVRIPNAWAGWAAPMPAPALPTSQALNTFNNGFNPVLQRVVIDSKFNVTAIWAQNDGRYNHMYTSRFTPTSDGLSGAWGAPQQLDGIDDWSTYSEDTYMGRYMHATTLLDKLGNITVTWAIRNYGQEYLVARRISATGALDANSVRLSGNIAIDIAAQSNSTPNSFVTESNMAVIFYSTTDTSVFSPDRKTSFNMSSFH